MKQREPCYGVVVVVVVGASGSRQLMSMTGTVPGAIGVHWFGLAGRAANEVTFVSGGIFQSGPKQDGPLMMRVALKSAP